MTPRRMLLAALASGCAIVSVVLLLILATNPLPRRRPPLSPTARRIPAKSSARSKSAAKAAAASNPTSAPTEGGTIRGQIYLGAAPTPARGAYVAALRDGVPRPEFVTRANASGAYELTGLDAGAHRVIAWGESLAQAPLRDEDSFVELEAGEVVDGVDRTLIDGCSVVGRVLREDTKKPISGAIVDWEEIRSTLSEADGAFRLDGIRPGVRLITARAPGVARKRVPVEAAIDEAAVVEIELAAGGVIEGRVTMPDGRPCPSADVSTSVEQMGCRVVSDGDGRYVLDGVPLDARDIAVFAALNGRFSAEARLQGFREDEVRATLDLQLQTGFTVAGRTIEADGFPVAGARLYVDNERPVATADASGRFRVDGVTSAQWMLTARKPGHQAASLELIGLRSAEERGSVLLKLEPGHFVEGKVVDGAGQPLEHAWVAVNVPGDDAGPYPSTFTDSEGRFRLEELGPKYGGIAAAKAGYRESRGSHPRLDTTDAVIVLGEAGVISVRVLEKGTGAAVRRFTVKTALAKNASPDAKESHAFSDGFGNDGIQGHEGSLQIDSELAPGVLFKLLVEADGFAERVVDEVEAWSAATEREPLRIELERGTALLGRVVSAATGDPISGARVRFVVEIGRARGREPRWFTEFDSTGKLSRQTRTDVDGRFTISAVSTTHGVLLLDPEGFSRTLVEDVAPGPALRTFAIPPGAAVEGVVRNSSGEAIAGVGVSVEVGGQCFPTTITRVDGGYRIDDLPEGECTIWLRPPRQVDAGEPLRPYSKVALRAGETSVADFVIAKGSIAGVVTRRAKPEASAFVFVTHLDGEAMEGFQTDAKGRFEIAALPRGAWKVRLDSVRADEGYRNVGIERSVIVGDGQSRCDIELATTIVAGRAFHAKSGVPATGAHLTLLDADGLLRAEFQCEPSSDRFELEAPGSGRFWLAAATSNAESAAGWIGPLTLEEGVGLNDVVVPIGGTAEMRALVLDAATGSQLERATARLVTAGSPAFVASGLSDAAGQVRFGDLSPGTYRFLVETDDHVPAAIDLDIGATPVERTVALERASRIVIETSGDVDATSFIGVEATCLAGGDPGWPRGAANGAPPRVFGTRPSGSTATLSFKSRPGRYRVRFVTVLDPHRSLDDPRNPIEELDVTIPADGETTVRLRAQAR